MIATAGGVCGASAGVVSRGASSPTRQGPRAATARPSNATKPPQLHGDAALLLLTDPGGPCAALASDPVGVPRGCRPDPRRAQEGAQKSDHRLWHAVAPLQAPFRPQPLPVDGSASSRVRRDQEVSEESSCTNKAVMSVDAPEEGQDLAGWAFRWPGDPKQRRRAAAPGCGNTIIVLT